MAIIGGCLFVLMAMVVMETRGHGGHGSHGMAQPQSFSDPNIVGDQEHMMQHLKQDNVNTEKPMSPAEMEFHYFRFHDTNSDNVLDGLELLKALSHMLPPMDFSPNEINGKTTMEVEAMKAGRLKEMMTNYVQIIDNVLKNDDRDKDGYLTYPEYSLARKRDAEKMQQMQEQMLKNAQKAKDQVMVQQQQPYNNEI